MRRTARRIVVGLALGMAGAWCAWALDLGKLRQAYLRASGGGAVERFASWNELLSSGRRLPATEQLDRVNDFFNRQLRFVEDIDLWGQSDYWATPMETLARGAGDCEDFAIAKYFTLVSLGVPVDRLRLTYVRARQSGPGGPSFLAHMVLAYYPEPDADPLVLDNLLGRILPASRRPDLLPVFNFNSQRIFQAGGGERGSGQVGQLSRWQDALRRTRNEGFD